MTSHRDLVLDIDRPGQDPLEVVAQLAEQCPDARTVVFGGQVRGDLIIRSIHIGAWGYVSKMDGEEALIDVRRKVLAGSLALSPELTRFCDN